LKTFTYAALQIHLQTDRGKSLVSQFEATGDAQSIYQELVKHALTSTAAQLSGDTLLQLITTTQYPETWRGTSHGFVLHWKEQVMKYKRLELEAFPPKQKLQLLQNAVGDVTELSYIKQIGDQDVARGYPALTYDSYMELLLLACSTYDKKLSLPGKQKRAFIKQKLINMIARTILLMILTMEDMKHTLLIRIFWKSWPTLAIPIAMVVLVILVKRSQNFFQEMNRTNCRRNRRNG
jgi:hypothetical protein